ncbi:adenylyl-sulfate kinase [Agitococcus lubricus]|uniref:Adenylyl-sulfate kinase n=1 Tax=Agitococcus lubricus TaxID=1077255 RepID=A0A2T5J1T7_9GAMM|nr:adenylyl-sulfate kinase [Agitococcus lubricus]PTQ90404.1 adenylylsulfate kinase [Agitococcus lubricus]
MASTNVVWQNATITREQREQRNGHRAVTLWFTGLSGSGKSTLSNAVEARLFELGCNTFVFDGDNIRHGLCKDLGFSDTDRTENIRRIGEVAKLANQSGVIALTAFISPFRADRDLVRNTMPEGDFIEVYVKCALEKCEERDVKGLYKKARAGLIPAFTGISSPYEEPTHAELTVDTGETDIHTCVEQIVNYLLAKQVISKA